MNISAIRVSANAISLSFEEDALSVLLADGRTIKTPLAWYPRLLEATDTQRQNYEILGEGEGIHWPDIDEDLSVAGMLIGNRAS
ncbi:MAG: DUF2442 domain-containing protein [Gammaproteobacteria bacterium]|nr:DUF2442 domain-containing protein [Gammaproteobacteria bacterium]